MQGENEQTRCCAVGTNERSRTRLASLLTVDERGQMVLPKDLRDRAGIRPGDKLALITWEKDGEICCFTLIQADRIAEMAKEFLEPVMRQG